MGFQPGEQRKTRSGTPVRIYATDAGGDYCIHGAWWNEVDGHWIPASWRYDGYFMGPEHTRPLDIV